jgi:hypothetical protein
MDSHCDFFGNDIREMESTRRAPAGLENAELWTGDHHFTKAELIFLRTVGDHEISLATGSCLWP